MAIRIPKGFTGEIKAHWAYGSGISIGGDESETWVASIPCMVSVWNGEIANIRFDSKWHLDECKEAMEDPDLLYRSKAEADDAGYESAGQYSSAPIDVALHRRLRSKFVAYILSGESPTWWLPTVNRLCCMPSWEGKARRAKRAMRYLLDQCGEHIVAAAAAEDDALMDHLIGLMGVERFTSTAQAAIAKRPDAPWAMRLLARLGATA